MSHEYAPHLSHRRFSSLLAYGESDLTKDDIIEFTSLIEKNSQLLMVLISDILDLSKIESNTMEFNFCNISLHQVLNEIGSAQSMNRRKVWNYCWISRTGGCHLYRSHPSESGYQ